MTANGSSQGANYDAIVIGAGFTGLYALHTLRDKLGLSVTVLEMADDLGGTWYWNRYPGARCDSESHSYCYTFSPELYREWEWSERYPGHAEIRRYLSFVADKLDLRKDIQFQQKVTGAAFDEATATWTVRSEAGDVISAQFLITGVGCLSSANLPDIAGRDDFQGNWYHTGQWPHEGVDFSGKRVAQIGTGSTGIQAAPVIAQEAAHLYVFQRTANYSVPAHNGPLSPERKAHFRENYDHYRDLMLRTTNGHPFEIDDRSVFDVNDTQRDAMLEEAWDEGGLRFRRKFSDVLVNKEANDKVADFIKAKIRQIVQDPETAERLADIDHPYASKRPPIDTHYFETFNRDNVSLIDVRSQPIDRITESGLQVGDTHYDVDIIVFATGFDAMTGTLLRLNLEGRGGRKLSQAWQDGPRNYLGLQIDGFPNLFTVTGPGSPSVLCNMPVPIEQHVEWIANCIAHMRAHGYRTIESKPEAVEGWVEEVNRAAKATLLYNTKHSWYLGANIPGKPRVFMPYAGGMAHYRQHCDEVAANDYAGFALS